MAAGIKKSLTFGDAVKSARKTAFSTMLKPIGSACNLDCHYCYYLDKADLYGNKQPVMDERLLEEYVRQYIEGNEVPYVSFNWHGGEPLITGVDFFRKAVEFQNKYKGDKQIENSIQTNGTLITDEWARFFAENNFLVGVSIDGPADIHDNFRLDKGGQPTFDRIIKGIEILKKHGAQFNTLTTINSKSAGRGREVYRFLKSIGSRYMQFLPVVEHVKYAADNPRPYIVPPGTEGAVRAEWSVTAEQFGQFMVDIFDDWVLSDVGIYYVQLFDVSLAQWAGAPASLCSFSETCGDALVVEHNGDVYSCDHFVYPEYKLGNISDGDLAEMLRSKEQFGFGINKRNTLPKACLRCQWYFACRGECPKHRFEKSADGENINALCDGYRKFFSYVDPYMKRMTELLAAKQPPALVMMWARQRMGLM